MKTKNDFVEYVMDQLQSVGNVTCRAMFGGYALYCNGKVVALICDNQLFVKPTEGGRTMIGTVDDAPPYPGAKLYFRIQDQIDDREWLGELIRITESELPLPKPKLKKRKKDTKISE